MALLATDRHWGILHHVDAPLWFKGVVLVIVLDFVLYIQHVLFHAVPLFWRFHMMHHALTWTVMSTPEFGFIRLKWLCRWSSSWPQWR